MAKWLQPFFLLAAKLYMLLVLLRPSKIPLPPDAISPQLEPENICESILDFTARFGEIKPDMPYLCRLCSLVTESCVSLLPKSVHYCYQNMCTPDYRNLCTSRYRLQRSAIHRADLCSA